MVIDTITAVSIQACVPALPDLSQLSHAEKDALILALWQRLEAASGADEAQRPAPVAWAGRAVAGRWPAIAMRRSWPRG